MTSCLTAQNRSNGSLYHKKGAALNIYLHKRIIAFTVLIMSWGSVFPVLKIGIMDSPPLLFAGIRLLFGGAFLLLAALIWGGPLQFQKLWPVALISSIFSVQLFFGFQIMTLMYIPSGLTAVLIYLQPVLVGFLAWIWLREPLSAKKVIGLVLGFLGVFTIGLEGLSGTFSLTGILLGVLSAVCWAIGTIYFKRVQDTVSLYWLLTMQFLMGGFVLLTAGLLFESWADITWSSRFWISNLYSALIGLSFAYLIYLKLLKDGEATRISAYLFVVPLVSVLFGVVFLRESVSLPLLVGGSLVVFGIYLVNHQPKTAKVRTKAYQSK